MFLDNISSELSSYNADTTTSFVSAFNYWKNQLLKFASHIFTWKVDGIPSREIETRLLLFGQCGIVRDKYNKLVAVRSNQYGITHYIDVFTDFNFATPIDSGSRKIDIDGVVIRNDDLWNGLYYMIHRYAVLLAHTEVTYLNVMINARDMKTYVASTNKVAESVKEFRRKLKKGDNDAIVDKSFIGLQVFDTKSNSMISSKELLDDRNNILRNFYEDIGVNKASTKRERLVVDEVESNNELLKLNLLDMFNCRKEGAEKIKNIFGVNCEVICNVDIDRDGDIEGGSNNED